MIWRKIPHRVQIYSFVAFLLSCAFCSFGLSSDVSATSYDCNFSGTVNANYFYIDLRAFYHTNSLNTSCSDPGYANRPFYFSIKDFNISLSVSKHLYFQANPSQISGTSNWNIFGSDVSRNNFNTTDIDYSDLLNSYFNTFRVYGNSSLQSLSLYVYTESGFNITNVSFTLTFYDSLPSGDCPVCQECQVCPAIPENPYDNKLDDIKKAIYVCGATLLVLYFFFCIYKIVVKDGGSR